MAIREEYQQIDTELKKEEERRRTLDMISAGFLFHKMEFVSYAAWWYSKTGQSLDDTIINIFSSFDKILEQVEIMLDKSNLDDILSTEEYQTIGNDNYVLLMYSNLKLCIDCVVKVLNHILKKYHSINNLVGLKDTGIMEEMDSTLKLCRSILSEFNSLSIDKSITFDMIKKYQLFSLPKVKDEMYELFLDEFSTIKQTRGLNDSEFENFVKELSEKFFYYQIHVKISNLVIYLLFLDHNPRYINLVISVINSLSSNLVQEIEQIFLISNHTIDEIFYLLVSLPDNFIKNLLLYFKVGGFIDVFQFSSISNAIKTKDLNLFMSSINTESVSSLDRLSILLELFYHFTLLFKSNTIQEAEKTLNSTKKDLESFIYLNPSIRYKMMNSNESPNHFSPLPPQLLEMYANIGPIALGFTTYFYNSYRHLLYPDDLKYFDQMITQEPYKDYCDKALLELDKLYPNNKTFFEFMRLFSFDSELNNQAYAEENVCENQAEEIETLESKPKSNSEMPDNPFEGLNREASKQCSGDEKGYVSMFIDYLIYRGYIDSENKDAYVCCLCDDPIPDDTLEHLKYNTTNKEGIRNTNIVTILFGRLTKFTANNQIVVDGKEISRGSIYFNDRQINNGELEEWCLFWPFLKGKNKEDLKKLFQGPLKSQDLKMENAFKRVTSFIEDYETTKQQNPGITKLDFIKMKHECH